MHAVRRLALPVELTMGFVLLHQEFDGPCMLRMINNNSLLSDAFGAEIEIFSLADITKTMAASVRVFWVTILLSTLVVAVDRCIDVGDERFTCTHDPLAVRKHLDGRVIDVGITQRIDGSSAEKTAIRKVLNQMDEYFFEDVLAMPEYKYVRPMCKNTNELCAFWTSIGECESNRVFMLSHCPATCRFCLLLFSGLA